MVAAVSDAPHILLIDDDPDLLSVLETVLTFSGFRVTQCENGADGLERAAADKPDLVVLDVMMPGKSGIEVMMDIRADEELKDIPILFLSAIGSEDVVVQALKGADDYVVKPFKNLELEARIRNILERTKPARAEALRGERAPERLAVQVGDDTYLVPLDQVYFIEASGKYAYAHTRNKRFLTSFSIGELDDRLAPTGRFLRVHRSYIINTDRVFKLTRDSRKNLVIVMSDEKSSEVRVSDSYLQSVKQKLGVK